MSGFFSIAEFKWSLMSIKSFRNESSQEFFKLKLTRNFRYIKIAEIDAPRVSADQFAAGVPSMMPGHIIVAQIHRLR